MLLELAAKLSPSGIPTKRGKMAAKHHGSSIRLVSPEGHHPASSGWPTAPTSRSGGSTPDRAPGNNDYFDSGSLGTSLSATVTGLPLDASMVHVRLWYLIGGVWDFSDFQYTSAEIDLTPPAAVTLSASVPSGLDPVADLVAVSSSGDKDESHSKDKAVDGDTSKMWISTPRSTMQTEQITLDMGAAVDLARVRLRSRADTAGAFPQDFQIQVSNDNVDFATVHAETGFVAGAATWYAFDFSPVAARYLRIHITRSVKWGSSYTVHLAEIEAFRQNNVLGAVQLEWTAPGDDGNVGTADSYDVRYSSQPIVNERDFDRAQQVTVNQKPRLASSPESLLISGLEPESVYYFALKTADESGNFSPLSNVVAATTSGVPPRRLRIFVPPSPPERRFLWPGPPPRTMAPRGIRRRTTIFATRALPSRAQPTSRPHPRSTCPSLQPVPEATKRSR